MTQPVPLACETTLVMISLAKLLPSRVVDQHAKKSPKYLCIASSIRELGLIEPLVVCRQQKASDAFVLLDGHLRYEILKDLGWKEVKCLISLDDEAFTYNHKVNRLPPIQEHFMIKRAIKNGVDEARIARALNIDTAHLRQKRDLLEGICPEVVELLRDRPVTAGALREIRRVKPLRQIEMAELMRASHSFSEGYAKCLFAATHTDSIVEAPRKKEGKGISADDMLRMQSELEVLGREFKIIEETHGKNTLRLVVLVAYLKRLLDNTRVVRFLTHHHAEVFQELQKIVESRTLQELNASA